MVIWECELDNEVEVARRLQEFLSDGPAPGLPLPMAAE